MVALGVSSIQTASAQGLTSPDPAKPWSISATLRGFYDDNKDTVSDEEEANLGSDYDKESFGFEIAPSARLNWSLPQTAIGLGYTYSYKWYDEKSYWEDGRDSQSHEFNAALEHAFSERYRISARDSFVIGQEPDQIRVGNSFTQLDRVAGDNIRNEAHVLFGADFTRKFGIELGYGNSFFDYEDDAHLDDGFISAYPSLSGVLDRMEHMVNVDGRLTLTPSTVGVLGYAFSDTGYLRDEVLGYSAISESIKSDDRNNRSHYVYAGADHTFTPELTGNLRVGARYNDYYNDPTGESDWSPYIRGSLRYAYLAKGYIEGGIGYDRTATDLYQVSEDGDFVRDQEAATIFATIKHQILPKLNGSLTGQFQHSTFNGGPWDNDDEQFYLAGLNLEYVFNRHFAAHVGYNYDLLDSDIPGREYDRNRVYLGVTATY